MSDPHPLYLAAEQADLAYSAAIAIQSQGKRNRWTMTVGDMIAPLVRAAYETKILADGEWLIYMRHTSELRLDQRVK